MSIDTGFIPTVDPLVKLDKYFDPWVNISDNLPSINSENSIKQKVSELELLDHTKLESVEELRRAYVILTMIASSYLRFKEKTGSILPKQIAIPLWHISKKLGICPISTHAGLDLWNFKRIDPSKPRVVENMQQITSFTGTIDELYFNLIMTEIEDIGSGIFEKLLGIPMLIATKNEHELEVVLSELTGCIAKINITMDKMFIGCGPSVFYYNLRPYLAGWSDEGVVFEGVSDEPTRFKGGSAAQSSLIQLFDIALGVYHESPFFKEMREYMPKDHVDILDKLAIGMKDNNIYEFIMKKKFVPMRYDKVIDANFSEEKEEDSSLKIAYKKCISELGKFRSKHFEMAYKYITKMNENSTKGTGGEELRSFLKTARLETCHNAK